MRILVIAGIIAFGAASVVGQTATSKAETKATTVKKTSDSPLVAASKKKPVKGKKAKLQINDETVKASRGKLSETPGLPLIEVPAGVPDHTEKLQKYDKAVEEWEKSLAETGKKIGDLTQEIADLETLTGSFEESFYNEDDPGYREVMEDKFNQAQERLTKAREELAKARQDEQALANGKPRLD